MKIRVVPANERLATFERKIGNWLVSDEGDLHLYREFNAYRPFVIVARGQWSAMEIFEEEGDKKEE